jgi:protein TonB
MGWLQGSQHTDPLKMAQTPIQTRQIQERFPARPSAILVTRHATEQDLQPAKQPAPVKTATTATPPSAQPIPQPDVTASPPLKAAVGTEDVASAKTENPAPVATSTPDAGAISKNTPSNEVRLPYSHANYLNNPQPPYPTLSLRLHESGKVVVRVLIGKNGQALRGEIFQSSGFERLDRSALIAVLAWRYIPGKIDWQAQDMWFDVPITFQLPN